MTLIAKTQHHTFNEPFVTESGGVLPAVTVAFETYGNLNATGDNAILVFHALTGDAHAAGKSHPDDKIVGWWDPMIGPGRPFDTDRYFVICSNVLGGCTGTTGPSSVNPATGKPYGMDFPVVTIRDMVRVQKRLTDYLGVKRFVTVAGGSMGGMQALEWGVQYPDMMDSLITIASAGRVSSFVIAFNEVQRASIMLDPGWNKGDYYTQCGPDTGLSLARMIGTITYKSDESMWQRFGRQCNGGNELDFSSRYEVENYLHYQGRKLVARFDANCYLYLTKAMDLHDVGRGFKSYEAALSRITVPLLGVGVSSDWLYPPALQQEYVNIINSAGGKAEYQELKSPYGHDAFLIEWEGMNSLVRNFLKRIYSSPGTPLFRSELDW